MRAALGTALWQERQRLLRPHFLPSNHFPDVPSLSVSVSSGLTGARLHYTTDGRSPSSASPRYTSPLPLAPTEGTDAVPVKAVAFLDDSPGPTAVHTYVLAPDLRGVRPAYVVSLSTSPEHLYGYEQGILVSGKRRDDMAHVPQAAGRPAKVYANYRERGRAWERPVDVEIFTANGTRILARPAGLRVSGGATRDFAQKSLRIIARPLPGTEGRRFEYPFFPATACSPALPPLRSFKNLLLSNAGQDLESAQLRSPLLTRLALRAGYRWASPCMPAALFCNGRYYGFSWLTPRFDAHLLGTLFDTSAKNFVVLDGTGTAVRSSPSYPYLWHWHQINAYNTLLARCARTPDDPSLLQALHRLLDVREALFYHAIQIYIDNRDWPDHNTRLWRYDALDHGDQPELDGRWRYILYDLDAAALSPWHGARPPSNPSLAHALAHCPLLAVLLRHKELAAQFANDMCDLAFGHYHATAVTTAMAELDAQSDGEPARSALRGVYHPADRREAIAKGRQDILRFFRERPAFALDELRRHLGYTRLYHVRVEGQARCNTLGPTNPEGWYFVENPVTLVPALPPNRRFLHWMVNDQRRTEAQLRLTAADSVDGTVRVRLVSQEVSLPLVVEQACDQGPYCGFALRNRSGKPVRLARLFLSDSPARPRRYALPDIDLLPGEVAHFAGKDVRHTAALGQWKLNFNPRVGETVSLRNAAGQEMSSAVVTACPAKP